MTARFDLVALKGTATSITYGSEADLRDSLHAFADAYGWDVTAEVIVPSWGRIDLVLLGDQLWLIELKRSITKPATLRRGLTQLHGYASAYPTRVDRQILVAPSFPDWADEMAAVAYPDIDLLTVNNFMAHVMAFASALNVDGTAVARLAATEHEAAVRRSAVAYLSRPEPRHYADWRVAA